MLCFMTRFTIFRFKKRGAAEYKVFFIPLIGVRDAVLFFKPTERIDTGYK